MANINEKPTGFATEKPDHIMISINGDAKTQMAITWRTDMSVCDGYIEYREENSDKIFKKDSENLVFKSDRDESFIHTAIADGLKPATKYFYTCGDKNNRSEEYFFTTEEENLEKFTFVAISDQQQGNFYGQDYSKIQSFLLKILEKHPEIKFIVTGGDNTDCGQHVVQWNGALAGMKGIMEYRPLMMTLGNHDNRGFKNYETGEGRYYAEPAEFFDTQFKMAYADNGPKNWKTENYSFDYGNVHFCIMGINGPDEVGEWIKEDIGSSDKTWKIGAYHFPIYYSNPAGQNFDAFPWMREGVDMCDIMLAGHEHNFSRTFPIKNDEIFSKPSEGTIHYMISTAGGGTPGCNSQQSVFHAAFYPQEVTERPSFALFEVDGKKMKITSYLGLDGDIEKDIVDEVIIDKEKDEILPHALAPVYRADFPRMVFKGMLVGIGGRAAFPEKKDGIWFAPLSVVFQSNGAYVAKEKGKMTLGIYGKKATFTESSDIAILENGEEVKLEAPVYRGQSGLLYVPAVSGSEIFGFRCVYVEHNNFLFWEHESESIPLFEQP